MIQHPVFQDQDQGPEFQDQGQESLLALRSGLRRRLKGSIPVQMTRLEQRCKSNSQLKQNSITDRHGKIKTERH